MICATESVAVEDPLLQALPASPALAPEMQDLQSILHSAAGSLGTSASVAEAPVAVNVSAPAPSANQSDDVEGDVDTSAGQDEEKGSLLLSIRLLSILPEFFKLKKALREAEHIEDYGSCGRLRDDIQPLRERLKAMPLCRTCYIPLPSPAARGPETWYGSVKQRNLQCNFCSVWNEAGLKMRAIRELEDTAELIRAKGSFKKTELQRLDKAVQKLKMKPGQGKGLKWGDKSRQTKSLIGQLTRTMMRVSVEPGMHDFIEPLGQALALLGAM